MNAKEIVKQYRDGTLDELSYERIENLFKAGCFERGQISILQPEHWAAFQIIFHDSDLDIDELKRLRERNEKAREK